MASSDPRFMSPSSALDPAARHAPVPVRRASPTTARPLTAPPVAPSKADHQVTLRNLKGIAIVATAVTVSAFGGLIVGHPVGSAASTTGPAPAGGSTVTNTNTNSNVAPVDPFFDPNPGSGGGTQAAPALGGGFGGGGGGGGGGGPAFQSGGS
jgi:uncharacterized membrane protein YgcG